MDEHMQEVIQAFNEALATFSENIKRINSLFNEMPNIEIVENWAKEHPIVTNADKFREVFGFKPYTKTCINGEVKVSCANCQYFYDDECAVQNRFWGAEYKPTKEGEE